MTRFLVTWYFTINLQQFSHPASEDIMFLQNIRTYNDCTVWKYKINTPNNTSGSVWPAIILMSCNQSRLTSRSAKTIHCTTTVWTTDTITACYKTLTKLPGIWCFIVGKVDCNAFIFNSHTEWPVQECMAVGGVVLTAADSCSWMCGVGNSSPELVILHGLLNTWRRRH
jgi:hypothetical protein